MIRRHATVLFEVGMAVLGDGGVTENRSYRLTREVLMTYLYL